MVYSEVDTVDYLVDKVSIAEQLVGIVDIVAQFVGTVEWEAVADRFVDQLMRACLEEEHSYFPGTLLELALVASVSIDCYLVAEYLFELILIVVEVLFEC